MLKSQSRPWNREAGLSQTELLLCVVILGLICTIAVPVYQKAVHKQQRQALVNNATHLHEALSKYHLDRRAYPAEAGPDSLNIANLDPLSTFGYFVEMDDFSKVVDGARLEAYGAPDVDGENSQYFAVLRHAEDDSIRVLAADTDLFGPQLTGVFVLEDGLWVQAEEVN